MPSNQPRSPEDKKNARLGCGIMVAFLLLIGGCTSLMNGGDDEKASSGISASDASDGDSDTISVPDYTGDILQTAQDAAQAKGIYLLKSHDLSMQGRMQVWDRNWQVCSQSPAPGTSMQDSETLDFGVVKTEEDCDDPDAAGTGDDDYTSDPTDEPTDDSSATSGDDSDSDDSSSSSGGSGSDDDSSGSSGGATSSTGSGGSSSSGGSSGSISGGGATAKCRDGSLSYAAHHQGACSHHGGVAVFYK